MNDYASSSAGEWDSAFHDRSTTRQTYPNPWALRNSRFACGPDAADVLDKLNAGELAVFPTGYGPDAKVLILVAVDDDTKIAFEMDPTDAAGFASALCSAVSGTVRTHGELFAA